MTESWIAVIHGISGFGVAFSGFLQILLPKEGDLHRYVGRFYIGFWTVVALTSFFIGHVLVLFIGLLGYYMALSGYRFAIRKSLRFSLFDKILSVLALGGSTYVLGYAIYLLFKDNITFGLVALFFGSIFLFSLISEAKKYVLRPPSSNQGSWVPQHFTRMFISYIAAMTAFSAIQNITGIILLDWMLPTIIGSSLIYFYRRQQG
ncbi:MAG TPA: hypothetical protein DDX92_11870 [Flavobacteriales bacterium]|mgnify:CR=1 FL=1|jgi:uncharacterized membrane protein|nr:hypothetical protein [Flavobacteriales bacterium]